MPARATGGRLPALLGGVFATTFLQHFLFLRRKKPIANETLSINFYFAIYYKS